MSAPTRPAPATPSGSPSQPVGSPAEATRLVQHMLDVMDALLGTVEEETELVRAGKLTDAAKLEPAKAKLSQMYVVDSVRLKASQHYLSNTTPELVNELRQRHDLFHALLQINLTVLATAHAISEGIMRGVSSELSRKATPQGYGASGQSTAPTAGSHQPLTLSRVF